MTNPTQLPVEAHAEVPVRLAPRPRPVPARHGGLTADWLFEGPGWPRLVVTGDALLLALAVAAALLGAKAADVPLDAKWSVLLYPLLVVALLALRGMYRRRLRTVLLDTIGPIV